MMPFSLLENAPSLYREKKNYLNLSCVKKIVIPNHRETLEQDLSADQCFKSS